MKYAEVPTASADCQRSYEVRPGLTHAAQDDGKAAGPSRGDQEHEGKSGRGQRGYGRRLHGHRVAWTPPTQTPSKLENL